MAADDGDRAHKVAMNQSAFRAANERTQRAANVHRFEMSQRVPFICECADPNCREIVMLPLQEYERLREHATRFLLVAGHEDDEADHERVLEAEAGYAIVEKIGPAGTEAARLDPRQGSGA